MKNSNYKYLVISLFMVVALSSCGGLKKMAKKADKVKIDVKPPVLEMHGGKVKVDFTATVPPNYFAKDAELIVTPVIKSDKTKIELDPKRLQGENVAANNQIINFSEGGNFNYVQEIDYTDDIRISDLNLNVTGMLKADTLEFKPRKIADGVITTPLLLQSGLATEENGYQKSGSTILFAGYDPDELSPVEVMEADIHFLKNRYNVRSSEKRDQDVSSLKENVEEKSQDEEFVFQGVEISAYASPDGPYTWNEELAKRRAKSAESYVKNELKKAGVDGAKDGSKYTWESTAEDWDGFKKEMEMSDIQDKDLILRVLTMYSDPVVREREILNIATAYEVVAVEVMPKLRRSAVKVLFGVAEPKTDSEILAAVNNNPGVLNPGELIYAASLTKNPENKLTIFKHITKLYPKCWRGHNNAACIYMMQDKMEKAEESLKKAEELNPGNEIVLNNLGVVSLALGKYEDAKSYFEGAGEVDEQVATNLAISEIALGNYQAAVDAYGNTLSFNAALAKLLNGDTEGALEVLNSITLSSKAKDPAINYYLKAVCGARMNNIQLAYANLRVAVMKDASLKKMAKTDLEFGKYFQDSVFINITK